MPYTIKWYRDQAVAEKTQGVRMARISTNCFRKPLMQDTPKPNLSAKSFRNRKSLLHQLVLGEGPEEGEPNLDLKSSAPPPNDPSNLTIQSPLSYLGGISDPQGDPIGRLIFGGIKLLRRQMNNFPNETLQSFCRITIFKRTSN